MSGAELGARREQVVLQQGGVLSALLPIMFGAELDPQATPKDISADTASPPACVASLFAAGSRPLPLLPSKPTLQRDSLSAHPIPPGSCGALTEPALAMAGRGPGSLPEVMVAAVHHEASAALHSLGHAAQVHASLCMPVSALLGPWLASSARSDADWPALARTRAVGVLLQV